MNSTNNNTTKTFVAKSVLWGLLLYGCVSGFVHWQEISGLFSGNRNSVVITATETRLGKTAIVSLDSMQRRIHIAQGIIQFLHSKVGNP